MEHSIALVTGATSGLGHAAARLLAKEGWHEIIVTGRSLAGAQQAAAQLAAENTTVIFTPLALDLDKPSSAQSAVAELVKRGKPIDFLLLNAGLVPFKKRSLTAAGIEASQAPPDRPSSAHCRIASCQPAKPERAHCYRRRGTCPRGRTDVQLHGLAGLRGQIPSG